MYQAVTSSWRTRSVTAARPTPGDVCCGRGVCRAPRGPEPGAGGWGAGDLLPAGWSPDLGRHMRELGPARPAGLGLGTWVAWVRRRLPEWVRAAPQCLRGHLPMLPTKPPARAPAGRVAERRGRAPVRTRGCRHPVAAASRRRPPVHPAPSARAAEQRPGRSRTAVRSSGKMRGTGRGVGGGGRACPHLLGSGTGAPAAHLAVGVDHGAQQLPGATAPVHADHPQDLQEAQAPERGRGEDVALGAGGQHGDGGDEHHDVCGRRQGCRQGWPGTPVWPRRRGRPRRWTDGRVTCEGTAGDSTVQEPSRPGAATVPRPPPSTGRSGCVQHELEGHGAGGGVPEQPVTPRPPHLSHRRACVQT